MSPNASLEQEPAPLAPVPSLSEMLILPLPEPPAPPRSLWLHFLRDLSFLLPAFGATLGLLLLRGQSPFTGATIFTVCALLLALRIHTAWLAWQERKQLAALHQWYRRHRRAQAEERKRAQDEWLAVSYVEPPPAHNASRSP